MDRGALRRLLQRVRRGTLDVTGALEALETAQTDPNVQGFATLDLHRTVRRGFPEAVYGTGKSADQIAAIVERQSGAGQTVLVTRVGPEVHDVVRAVAPGAEYHPAARAISVRAGRRPRLRRGIVVVTAGTSDLPVAEEAALTAELMGNQVERVIDVGVAGLHRLAPHLDTLTSARVIVVVAGMEGALPTVIAGLTACPVVGVPTSVGYGAGGDGEAALLGMLNSCAGGLTVVNIDNGYSAGCAAGLINSTRGAPRGKSRQPNRRTSPKTR